jgi:S-DNA-T family DNA segregation ATPase FtsK/SpoIIIE
MFDPVLQKLRDLGSAGLLLSGDREEGPLVGSARPSRQPAGRGQLVQRRGEAVLVQTALVPEPRWGDDENEADEDEAAVEVDALEDSGAGRPMK